MESLFSPQMDSRVMDITTNPGFDIRPLIEHFGPDVTWKQIFLTDDQELMEIPGYGRRTLDKIYAFISKNFQFTFEEFLESRT